MKTLTAALVLVLGSAGSLALADVEMVNGEVKEIDQEAGQITLEHGPIKNINTDGMTCAFGVRSDEMLKAIKVGDKVKFEAERTSAGTTITKLHKLN
ncbi:copper-binding protein [Bradyrhizobium sp.]|uniref:copper-binding protein n=1 Tax=Bradyrhizobium sp. TaxID=376 RepID=UPI00391D772B